jgi:Cu/Ag efflux protein CusF
MFRISLILGVLLAPASLAQDEIQRGTIKKVDAKKGILTITVEGEDKDYLVSPQTKLMKGPGQEISDGLKDKSFKIGVAVMFKAVEKDRRLLLRGLMFAEAGADRKKGKPGGISSGIIKKIDVGEAKISLTISSGGTDKEYLLSDTTLLLDFPKKPIREALKNKIFKPGAKVMFKAVSKDGENVLVGLKFGDTPNQSPPVKVDTSGFKPLPELGTGKYHGFMGGLYPEGKNQRPSAHEAAGLARAKKMVPLDADGKPNARGKIVLISVGMSNTTGNYSTIKKLADRNSVV